MEVKHFRAKSLQEALRLVRQELGPGAAVLQTRQVDPGLWGWLSGARQIEVSASCEVNVPSRFARDAPGSSRTSGTDDAEFDDYGSEANSARTSLRDQLDGLQSMVEELCRQSSATRHEELPAPLFALFTDLIDAEVSEPIARELVERVRMTLSETDRDDPVLVKARLIRQLENEIDCCGPLVVTPGRRRVVALVGPTGVGKTTTIAKLAAHFHLQQRNRVGLLTVDTYRIAAVDQLRTYAEIINLPMEVAATPREVRTALGQLAEMDLVLIDTVGRSPRDEVRIQELQSLLAEAQADEVHLVLSSVASAASARTAVDHFAPLGASALIVTKLDEASGLGSMLPLLRHSGLPLSYVTHGQNVPQDIAPADRRRLARAILRMQAS
jgi:flagellar biosynthesis protein FlhF